MLHHCCILFYKFHEYNAGQLNSFDHFYIWPYKHFHSSYDQMDSPYDLYMLMVRFYIRLVGPQQVVLGNYIVFDVLLPDI